MTLTIQRADLARTLAAVCKVTESRNTVPILANVLLSATAGTLTVTGTDLDIQYSAVSACEGELNTTVDAKRLSDIARRLSGDVVTLTLDGDKLTVKSGRSRFTLPTLPVEDFPSLEGGAPEVEFKVDLASLVAPVKFAISTEETRYYLNGIYLHATKDGLRAVATDGHRLAYNTVASVGDIPSVIIPRKTVGLIPTGEIDVSLSPNKIRFATADTIIVSKLVDGTFPSYERVIPHNNDRTLTVERRELTQAVARVSSVATERGKAAKLSITANNIAIDIRSDDGTAHEDIPAEYDGPDMEIGFNSQYLGDVLGSVSGDHVTVKLSESGSPGVFTGDCDVLALCMPMRA